MVRRTRGGWGWAVFVAVAVATTQQAGAKDISLIRFTDLLAMINRQTDTTCVFNFFATWCDPCKEEFPAFQEWASANARAHRMVKLIFISLDFKSKLEHTLLPYIERQRVTEDVFLLDETDYNAWIDRVDSTWDGNIPMTLVVNNRRGIRKGFARTFTVAELNEIIQPLIP